jgi:4a-hydroxytetrahydrobiopterin dehydratase
VNDANRSKGPALLDAKAIRAALDSLDGWELIGGERLRKTFKFSDFTAAFAFMTRCAPVADELDHHPEWSNVYNRVTIELTTHDAGGITDLDIAFARRADALQA